jgi:hypothetical protein
MKDRKNKIDRRSFLRTVGAAGLAPVAASLARPSTGGLAPGFLVN